MTAVGGPALRIRRFAIADAAATFAGTALAIAVYVFAVPSRYMLALAGLLVVTAVLMLSTVVPLGRGDNSGALMRLAIANWSISVAVAATATFAWPVMVLAALLPAVLAPTFVQRSHLRRFIVPSLVLCFANAMLGLLQDYSGISDESPTWLNNLVLVVSVPVLGALVALSGVQHNLQVEAALEDAVMAQAELADHAAELRRSRSRLVVAADGERRRIERDLHDGAQQRLVGLRLRLRRTADLVRDRRSAGADASGVIDSEIDVGFADVFAELQHAVDELRALGQGLFPPVLAEHGLIDAIRAIADRSQLPIVLDLSDVGRLAPEVEAAVYFCCVESIHNANKHAGASEATVLLRRDDHSVEFVVTDDGSGFGVAGAAGGTGLTNMRDRLGAVGGELDVRSNTGRGTAVAGRVPLPA